MSNSRDFVIKRIEKIARLLPDIQLRYEHREIHAEHIVEVSPKYFYEDGSRFEGFEIELYSEFLDLFPEETILVIPPDDIIKIATATHTACSIIKKWISFKPAGMKYDVQTKYCQPQIVAESEFNYAKAA